MIGQKIAFRWFIFKVTLILILVYTFGYLLFGIPLVLG